MKRNFNTNPVFSEFEENAFETPEPESPPSTTTFNEIKLSPSPKRSRRSLQKRVVSVPIKNIDSSRAKGDTAPPSDLWAWRKYGQKPIKGSPYPRGYYRCSSSKGCPARKQVERSRDNPTMILITYTCEHNHPWPVSRTTTKTHLKTEPEPEPEPEQVTKPESEQEPDERLFLDLDGDVISWFGGIETTPSPSTSVLREPLLFSESDTWQSVAVDDDVTMIYRPVMEEEDESLFADLGELPGCSVVFRHRNVGPQVEIC